jgi:hypothetical protein
MGPQCPVQLEYSVVDSFWVLWKEDIPEDCNDESSNLQLCFDPGELDSLPTSEVTWWDETHKKSTIGGLVGHKSANKHYAIFPHEI